MVDIAVLDLIEDYNNQLKRLDTAAMGRLIKAYGNAFNSLDDKLRLVMDEIAQGGMTTGKLVRMERYKALMEQVAEKLRDLQALTLNEMETLAQAGIKLGSANAAGIMAAVLGDGSLAAGFARLPDAAIRQLLGFLQPEGELYRRIGLMGKVGSERVAEAMVNAIALGYNPRKIADQFRTAFGMSLTDSLRLTRTANLWAYREANRATYVANGDVIEGWTWHSTQDADTCAACLAEDNGEVHPLDEPLEGHYNCRCAMVPVVKGLPGVFDKSGEDVFNSMTESSNKGVFLEKANTRRGRMAIFSLAIYQ